jgi:RIO kinase 1
LYTHGKKVKPGFCDYEGTKPISSNLQNSITTTFNKEEQNRVRIRDKQDRATVDQVLDPRTLSILKKWLKNGTMTEIFGSVSTGKEANVYYAYRKPSEMPAIQEESEVDFIDPKMAKKEKRFLKKLMKQRHEEKVARSVINFDTEKDFAVKIFKTTVLVFRDRERYIEGEFRFRKAKFKNNPFKMVKQWAEKEMRNLKRLRSAGLNVPEPYLLKNNIILMEFIGDSGLAAPRLKDAGLTEEENIRAYFNVLKLMRRMLKECKLVHGDFSEYNMLYYKDEIYIIDVSQSVELDHPMALDFLRRDCVNINDYFDKQNIQVLTIEKTFDFICDNNISESEVDTTLQALLDKHVEEIKNLTHDEKRRLDINDKVFQNVYIPRSLMEMSMEDLDLISNRKSLPFNIS